MPTELANIKSVHLILDTSLDSYLPLLVAPVNGCEILTLQFTPTADVSVNTNDYITFYFEVYTRSGTKKRTINLVGFTTYSLPLTGKRTVIMPGYGRLEECLDVDEVLLLAWTSTGTPTDVRGKVQLDYIPGS